MVWRIDIGKINSEILPIDLYNCLFRQRNHRNGRILFRWHHQQFHVKISNVQKKMHKPEFYRRQNQQANPTQQQMLTPIIRRITYERKNWRPFFHQKIQMRVKKTREKYFIFFTISPVFQPRLQRNLQRRQRSANQSQLKSKVLGLSAKLGKHSAIWGKLGAALQAYTLNPCNKFPPNPTSRKVNT